MRGAKSAPSLRGETEGRPQLVDAPTDIVREAAPLARASRHLLARSLAAAAGDGPVAADVIETSGLGVEGSIGGRLARLGRAGFVGAADTGPGETELWFGFVDGPKTRLRFADCLRPDAATAIVAIRRRGLRVQILSGDTAAATARAALSLDVADFHSGLTPFEKAASVEAMTKAGHKVLMVGDGLNDAAALAKAHASMAPGAAIDAAQNAADLVFQSGGLWAIVAAIDVARAARRRALENFAFSALYNAVAAPAAVLGLVNPFIAALAMSASSMVVTLNALRVNFAGRARR